MSRIHWAIAFCAVLAVAACGNKKKPAQKEDPPAEPVAKVEQTPPGPENKPGPLQEVTPAEFNKLFVAPENAEIVTPPQQAPGGERIQAAYCVKKASLDKTVEGFKTAMAGSGWQDIVSPASRADRVSLTASRTPYRMTALFMRADIQGCPQEDNNTYVTVQFSKLRAGASAVPAAPSPPEGATASPPATVPTLAAPVERRTATPGATPPVRTRQPPRTAPAPQ